jgi:hypothetical protein
LVIKSVILAGVVDTTRSPDCRETLVTTLTAVPWRSITLPAFSFAKAPAADEKVKIDPSGETDFKAAATVLAGMTTV